MLKGSILQEDIIIPNMYVPNRTIKLHETKTELQGETDEYTIIVGDCNACVSEMDWSSKQKISKDTVNSINPIVNWRHLTSIDYFIQRQKNIFFSNSHITFAKTDYILGLKTHFNKFIGTEIIQCLLLCHNRIKLEIDNRMINWKVPKYMDTNLNNTFLNNKQTNEEILR